MGKVVVCHTRDISTEGCFLDTAEEAPLGTPLTIALMDNQLGAVVETKGRVQRCIRGSETGFGRGIGVRLIDPPVGWTSMVDRYQENREDEGRVFPRLQILVVGDEERRRGALALYVRSGWDVRFATDLTTAREALYAVELDAVIAEHNLDDARWAEILATSRRIQPKARRIVRSSLEGHNIHSRGAPDELVHRVVDLDSGLDALVDALTAELEIAQTSNPKEQ